MALGGVIAACGSSSPGPPSVVDDGVVDDRLVVVGQDIDFAQDDYVATPGPIDITLVNDGNLPHTLVVEDHDGFTLRVNTQGDVDEGIVDLDPGTYTIFCDIAGHRNAGMVATLTVEEP